MRFGSFSLIIFHFLLLLPFSPSQSVAAGNELHALIESLEEELEKQARDFKANVDVIIRGKVEQEQRAIQADEALQNHEMACKLDKSLQQEQLKIQCKCPAFPSVNELENTIQSLEDELKKQSEQCSQSVATINEAAWSLCCMMCMLFFIGCGEY